MSVDWKDSPTVQLVEALLDDEESREAYKDTCAHQIRKRIDPEYDHFELADQSEEMAVSYVALTERYIRFAARLIEQAAIYAGPNYDDDISSLSIPPSYTDPVELRELITRIWMPLPGYEVSDFVWLEVLYAALLSNHVVQLIDSDYRRKRNLGAEQARLDFIRSQAVERLLGKLTQRLLSSFDRTFLTKRDLRGIDVVGTRLVTRERATGSSWLYTPG